MTCTGDAAQVQALLAWARSEGIELTRVSMGTCSVEVATSRPAASTEGSDRAPTGASSLYSKLGGDLFKEAVERGDLDAGALLPVVGRR